MRWWLYGFDADVATGVYGEQIDAMVEGFAALQRPVWLRLGYELNGGWTDFKPESVGAAWIHLTKKFCANPVRNRTVANVWDNTADALLIPEDPMQWYYNPGDEWADWWGVNICLGVAAPDSRWVTSEAVAASWSRAWRASRSCSARATCGRTP